MIALTVNVSSNLDSLRITRIDPRYLAHEGALAVRAEIESCFYGMAEKTESMYFWPEAIDTLSEPKMDGDVATITAHKVGVRIHWKGGTIKPTERISRMTGNPVKSLFVPMSWLPKRRLPLAKMSIPKDRIKVIPRKGRAPLLALVDPRPQGQTGKKSKITTLGILLKQVNIKAKPEVMPTEATMYSAARSAIMQYLDLMS